MREFSQGFTLLEGMGFLVELLLACAVLWLFLFVFNQKLKRKYKKRYSKSGRVYCYIALILVAVFDFFLLPQNFAWVAPLLFCLILFAYLLIYRKGKFSHKIFWLYLTLVFYALCWQTSCLLGSMIHPFFAKTTIPFPESTLIALLACLLFALLCALLARQKHRSEDLTFVAFVTESIVPTLSGFVIAFVAADQFSNAVSLQAPSSQAQMIILLVLYLVNAAVLVLHDYLLAKSESRFDEDSYAREMELTQIHYKELQSLYDATRTWRHDYINHLQAIDSLNRTHEYDELSRYIAQLQGSVEDITFKVQSGNKLVDAFLNAKLSHAESLGIEFEIDVQSNLGSLIFSAVDLTSLIGNLADNAIEACERIEDKSAQKHIAMKVTSTHTQLLIMVKNSMAGPVALDEEGNLITSKSEGDHGIGTKQIDAVIKKYKGQLTRSVNSNVFETYVTLPLNK